MTLYSERSERGNLSSFDLIVMGFSGALLVAARYLLPPEYLKFGSIAVGILLLIVVFFAVWKVRIAHLAWHCVRSLITREPLIFMTQDAKGRSQIKCPECGTKCTTNPISSGEEAFRCPECGTTATWHNKA